MPLNISMPQRQIGDPLSTLELSIYSNANAAVHDPGPMTPEHKDFAQRAAYAAMLRTIAEGLRLQIQSVKLIEAVRVSELWRQSEHGSFDEWLFSCRNPHTDWYIENRDDLAEKVEADMVLVSKYLPAAVW